MQFIIFSKGNMPLLYDVQRRFLIQLIVRACSILKQKPGGFGVKVVSESSIILTGI